MRIWIATLILLTHGLSSADDVYQTATIYSPIDIANIEQYEVRKELYLLDDVRSVLDYKLISQQYIGQPQLWRHRIDGLVPNIGYSKASHWAMLHLHNTADHEIYRSISLDTTTLDMVDFYVLKPDDETQFYSAG
ncbi:MAG: 7TM-DISM domain-containing protein, partial [Kangiellaceae bacterium]|nr:7TM-DISM domain-containing protein [Kangiellaceae bacterium]